MLAGPSGRTSVGQGYVERGHHTISPRVGMNVYLEGEDRPALVMGEQETPLGAWFGAAAYQFISRPIIFCKVQ